MTMTEESAPVVAVVVLAGGRSRRFGSDKLDAEVGGRTLLRLALDGLPAGASVAVVGPERPLTARVQFVREDPPLGGPAAALITGLRWALDLDVGAEAILTLPGDAPHGGRAAAVLLDALAAGQAEAVVGVDGAGRDQVLQLALRPTAARALVTLAGPGGGQGLSVRRLIEQLIPPARRRPLSEELSRDIDTTDQLAHFRNLGRA
jgi:molybdopterin-guanine dinucleotide biosynthesis protein A